jgi:ankyrin repeat protein
LPETSIHEACRRGDIDAVRALIAADPHAVDVDDEHGWRPIFHAGLCRHEAVVRLLIESGADLAAHDGYVMHYAGEVPNNKAIVSLLVQYGALDAHTRPTDDLSRQFLAAVFLADAARVRSLLSRHPRLARTPVGRGDHPIHHAARNGDTEVVQLLIQYGADVNVRNPRGHTVLYCAGGHGHLDTLQLLLNAGVHCDAKFTHDAKTLLEWLAQYPDDPRYAPITEALQRHRAEHTQAVNQSCRNPEM